MSHPLTADYHEEQYTVTYGERVWKFGSYIEAKGFVDVFLDAVGAA